MIQRKTIEIPVAVVTTTPAWLRQLVLPEDPEVDGAPPKGGTFASKGHDRASLHPVVSHGARGLRRRSAEHLLTHRIEKRTLMEGGNASPPGWALAAGRARLGGCGRWCGEEWRAGPLGGGAAGPEENPVPRTEPDPLLEPFSACSGRCSGTVRSQRGRRDGLPPERRLPSCFVRLAGRRRGARGPAPRLLQRRTSPRTWRTMSAGLGPPRGSLREHYAATRPGWTSLTTSSSATASPRPRPDLGTGLGPGGRSHSPPRQSRYRPRASGPLGLLPRSRLLPPPRLRPTSESSWSTGSSG